VDRVADKAEDRAVIKAVVRVADRAVIKVVVRVAIRAEQAGKELFDEK
jgi:hypothetical protein